MLTCGWLTFKLIDQSVTIDHLTQQNKLLAQQRTVMINVIKKTAIGSSKELISDAIKGSSSTFIKERGHTVADQVSFFFENEILIDIKYE